MADLRTSYMGIELKNPLVVGACSLSKQIDTLKQLEAAGAGAVVIKSLFEEQIQLEREQFDSELSQFDEMYAEAVNLFPGLDHGGPKEHLHWIERSRKEVGIPLIASLNAVNKDVWVEYAKALAATGVDGLELNFYSLPLDPDMTGADIEAQELEIFAAVRAEVKLPIAVKLHPFYTNVMNVAARFDKAGADALVLFNRLFQPDISIEGAAERKPLVLSDSRDALTALRWVALLHGRVEADIVGNTGVMTGEDAAKMILAGASAVQVVSTLYKNRVTHLGTMIAFLGNWMDRNNHPSLAEVRGRVSKQKVKDPWAFERGQYIKALLGFD